MNCLSELKTNPLEVNTKILTKCQTPRSKHTEYTKQEVTITICERTVRIKNERVPTELWKPVIRLG